MNHELFQKLNELTTQIQKLEEEKAIVKEQVMAEMEKENMRLAEYPFATYSIGTRKKWEYSPAVVALTDAVKAKKHEEEETGVATYEETSYLIEKTKNDS